MKKLIVYLLLGIVATSFTACSDNNYTSRLKELIIEDMTFDHGLSTKTLSFRHEDLSNYECKSSEEWCVAALDVANSKLTVSVKANETYDSRTATITLADKLDGTLRAFTVTQGQANSIIFDQSSFDVPMEGGTVAVTMKSNVKYEVVIPSDCEWISLAPEAAKSRGMEESTFTLVAKENTGYKERTALITVTSKDTGVSGKITVRQPFNPVLKADNNAFEVAMEGNTVSVNVESNVPYEVNIPCDWITQVSGSKTRASKTSVVSFRVDANTSGQDRTATVKIKNTYGDEEISVTISQKFSIVFNVDESPLVIDELGGIRGINVAANVDVAVQSQADWLKAGEKKAGGKGYWTQEVIISALKNKVAQREGTIKFLHAPTNKAFNVKITQNRLLYITEQELYLNEGDEPKPITLNNPNAMEVSWSSSDTSVATVNNTGNVTAGKAGTAEITVTSADKKYSDKVKVTVNVKAAEK